MRGLMVAHTGGFAPQTPTPPPLMRTLAAGRVFGIPDALVRLAGGLGDLAVMLQRTVLGRAIYALGNKEAAAYLAGVNTKGVTVACFALCGLTSGLAGGAARRIFAERVSGHGRCVSSARDRRRRHRRHRTFSAAVAATSARSSG